MSIHSIPTEAYAPSIVDPDAVLPNAASDQFFEPVTGRGAQVVQCLGRIKEKELAQRPPLNIGRQSPRSLTPKHSLRLAIPKTANHESILSLRVNIVKRYYLTAPAARI
jgi:hypothetical protein